MGENAAQVKGSAHIGVWILAGIALAALCTRGDAYVVAHKTPAPGHRVDLISIDGPINPAAADFIDDSIKRASTDSADALVIQLDTPGGLLTSAQQIVKSLLNSPVPVIVYVAPSGSSAASAGTFVTEAANLAAMAPGTTIGAAHPVEMTGGNVEGALGTKIENYTASFARTIAQQRGRNEQWMEDAVRRSASIDQREALKLHVIDIVASDLNDLLAQASNREVTVAGGRRIKLQVAGGEVRTYEMRFGERVLNRLADPNLMYLLLIAGLLGIYFEFAHPGVYLPGVAGAICLLLALASFQVIPINLTGLLLILLGVGLLVTEAFVTSYGVLGMGGVIAFLLGSLFLIDASETDLRISFSIIVGAAFALAAIILSIGFFIIRERRQRPKTGAEGLLGEIAEVRDQISPGVPGRVFVHGEIWRAVSNESIAAGNLARVTGVRGLEVMVRPISALDR